MKTKRFVSTLLALLLICSLPVSAFADNWYLENGDIAVNATESGQTVSQGEQVNVPDSAPVITQSGDGTTSNTVTITATENATANVTIQDVNIDTRSTGEAAIQTAGNGNVTIELDGTNTVQSDSGNAGVQKTNDGNLTISDENETDGSLKATGGTAGAGIGGGPAAGVLGNNITITGGTIEAIGGTAGAGIGGGSGQSADEITITGGKVTATGKGNAAGIGGGAGGSCSNITISGGDVEANGSFSGAGIGGAGGESGRNITITGGTIKATGGTGNGSGGAGIGGGAGGIGSNISISGGDVEAHGGDNAAGIGGGAGGSGKDITVSGSAEVTAKGGDLGSGIGGGAGGPGSNITINGSAEVNAQGGDRGAGIGGGAGGPGSDITISGGAEVTAKGGLNGAGIGGGAGESGSNINIGGSAEVTAKGGLNGAGIGGGIGGTGGVVTVSGDAQVKAQGGDSTAINETDKQGEGAAIGNGGSVNKPGAEVTPDTAKLNEGWIATYAPDTTDLDTATPKSLTYKDDNGALTTSSNAVPIVKQEPTCTEDGHRAGFMVGGKKVGGEPLPATGHSFTNYVSNKDGSKTAKCDYCDATDTISAPGSKLVRDETAQTAPLYRVIGQDGKALACKTERKDGVLTITVDADYAALTGKLGGIQTLKARGVETVVFVTKGATSTFALADLLAQGSAGDSYTLTHDGGTVTFTLNNGADAGTILQ